MSPIPTPLVRDANDESARWQAWDRSYMTSSNRAARKARIAFALLLTASAVWLGLQIMSMPV
jgi:hypothetical protein